MPRGDQQGERYVISVRRATGLGDHLICLAAAWLYARATGRTLVADWRFSPYTLAAKDDLFSLCFEVPETLAGVPFITGEDAAGLNPLDGRGSFLWRLFRRSGVQRPSLKRALALIEGGRDIAAKKIVIEPCVNHAVVHVGDLRTFFSALTPVSGARAAVAAFRAALPPGPVIGLHMRHGNGASIPGYAPHWRSFSDAIDRCLKTVGAARSRLGPKTTVFLSTDSQEVETALRANIDGLVTRPKMLRHAGDGELHLWRGAALAREDALVEMLLLAECDALIRYPPASFFSFYGAAMGHGRGLEEKNIDVLQRPRDASDPLSPALLFSFGGGPQQKP